MRYNFLILFVILAGVSPDAHAYIDPGTGSAILQGILGAIAALVLTVRLWWHRLLVLLGIRKRVVRPEPAGEQTNENK